MLDIYIQKRLYDYRWLSSC